MELEQEMGAKIITVTGISPSARLDNRASEKIIRNLQKVGTKNEVLIFLYTYGGEIEAGWKVALEILGRQAKTTIIVTHRAKSTGTLVSLAGTEILARRQSEFGPIDPQIRVYRGGHLVYLPALELLNSIDGYERVAAERAIRTTKDYLRTILENRFPRSNKMDDLLSIMLRENPELEKRSHSLPLLPKDLHNLGFNVKINELAKFCELYTLYLDDSDCRVLERDTHVVEMSIL